MFKGIVISGVSRNWESDISFRKNGGFGTSDVRLSETYFKTIFIHTYCIFMCIEKQGKKLQFFMKKTSRSLVI